MTVEGRSVLPRGTNFSSFPAVSDARIVRGDTPAEVTDAVVGADVAAAYGHEVGDTLLLGGSTKPALHQIRMVGTFRGPGYLDDQLVVSLPETRHLTGLCPDEVNPIRLDRSTSGNLVTLLGLAGLATVGTVAAGFAARVRACRESIRRWRHQTFRGLGQLYGGMTVREHNSQHDRVESLPLVSKSATVAEVDAMDRRRGAEVRERLLELARRHGFTDLVPERGRIDWDTVFERAARTDRKLAPQIGALRDRFEREHPAMVRIVLETDEPVGHAAGQYVSIRYGSRTRAYSIASSPNRDETELCVRRVGDGRLSPRLCDELSVGDVVTIRGPNGHLLLEDSSERDAVFLATGTGVAPMKSMIDYTFEDGWDEYRGTARDVWLFLGAAWEDDLPYHEAFQDRAATHENFHYVPCLSREPWLSDWDGETEYIQDALLKYVDERALEDAAFGRHMAEMLANRPETSVDARLNPHAMEVYACGINAMVYSLETAVNRLGVPRGRVHCEGYG